MLSTGTLVIVCVLQKFIIYLFFLDVKKQEAINVFWTTIFDTFFRCLKTGSHKEGCFTPVIKSHLLYHCGYLSPDRFWFILIHCHVHLSEI